MNHLIKSVLLGTFMTVSGAVVAQNLENAGDYMEVISKQQQNISKKFMSYTSAAAHGKKARKVENLRNKLLNEVQEARMTVDGLPSFKGDKSYRDTTVKFLKFYYNILNDDYAKILNMEELAEQSYDDMELYLKMQEQIDVKLKEGNDMMKRATQRFADANHITLLENKSELGEMMDKVHNLNIHYNDVYLIFFKPYIQESNLLDAIQKGNITAIEQNRNSLLKYAKEGLEKIAAIKPYEGDNSVIGACKIMLNFYVREAEGGLKNISDFFLAKERFEAIQAEYKKKRNASKEDVEAYNKGVNEINAASEAYNRANKTLYEERKEKLEEWNKSVSRFFDEHTPKYK